MSLSKVRTYISESTREIDSDLKQWDSPIDVDNVPETCADGTYSIKLDLVTADNDQQTVSDVVEAEMRFLFKGFRDTVNKYDESIDLVDDIRLKLLNKKNIQAFITTDNNPIATVTSNSLTGDFIDSNERQLIITLSVNFLIYQTIY